MQQQILHPKQITFTSFLWHHANGLGMLHNEPILEGMDVDGRKGW